MALHPNAHTHNEFNDIYKRLIDLERKANPEATKDIQLRIFEQKIADLKTRNDFLEIEYTRLDKENRFLMSQPRSIPMRVRYTYANEITEKQRLEIIRSDLYKIGDTVLVWVNEGDLCMVGEKLLPPSKVLTNPAREPVWLDQSLRHVQSPSFVQPLQGQDL